MQDIRVIAQSPLLFISIPFIAQVEKSCAEFLLIHGAVDRLVLPYNGMRIARRLWDHGKDNVALHIYPGAGHIIEPRNSPICIGVFHNVLSKLKRSY